MDDLGIEEQELTAEDKAAIEAEAIPDGAAPASAAPPAPAAAPKPASQPVKPDYISELERLADLRDRGILTPEEFEAKKKQVLGL